MMNLRICLDNLKHDLNNGGIEEDSFAMNCYITMANEARRMLKRSLSQSEIDDAIQYLSLCRDSGASSLQSIASGN